MVGNVSPESDQRLMRIHIATLFNCDAQGRIVSLRRPWSRSGGPPRFFMGRRPDGNVWLFRDDIPEDLTRKLEELCRSEPLTKDLMRPPSVALAIRAALEGHSPVTREYRGPAYLIPEGTRAPSDAVLITKEKGRVLEAGFPWMLPPLKADVDIGPVAAAVVDGSAVSICYCARLSPLAAEAGVETLDAMRGRGYATAAVAAWATAMRGRGLLPLYGTSWENVASQRVAEKVGAVCVGEDWEIE